MLSLYLYSDSLASESKRVLRKVALSAFALLGVVSGTTYAVTLNVPSGAYPTIQSAVDAAATGDTVLVADGTYTGAGNRDINPAGKDLVIKSSGGSSVCTIDCEGSSVAPHRAFVFESSESAAMKVDGFTLKNGYAPVYDLVVGIDSFSVQSGGAIICVGASPSFQDIVMTNNVSELGGAVSCVVGSNATFRDCAFISNYTFFGPLDDGDGGALFAFESNLSISKSTFISNSSSFDGGGISVDTDAGGMTLKLDSCVFAFNVADSGGGAISVFGVALDAKRTLFAKNETSFIGGAALINGNDNNITSTFTNCTISDNKVTGVGAGDAIFLEANADVVLTQCIVTGNGVVANTFTLNCEGNFTTYTLNCTNMWGNADTDFDACAGGQGASNNNFSADPMFCMTSSLDYSIDVKSLCAPANSPCGLLVGAVAPVCDNVVGCCNLAGDFNHDGVYNIVDLTDGIARVFTGGGPPVCQDEADSNGDNVFNIVDITFNISRIFTGGPAPICGTSGN